MSRFRQLKNMPLCQENRVTMPSIVPRFVAFSSLVFSCFLTPLDPSNCFRTLSKCQNKSKTLRNDNMSSFVEENDEENDFFSFNREKYKLLLSKLLHLTFIDVLYLYEMYVLEIKLKKSCWNLFQTEKVSSTWCLERKHENCSPRTFSRTFSLFQP